MVTGFTRLLNKAYYLFLLTAIQLHINQTFAADDTFIINRYTDDHGLPQNSIKGIGQDNLGFIWLISEKGPIRYDGQGQFRTFDELSETLKAIRMSALYKVDRSDELWARSEIGELVLLKSGKAALSENAQHEITRNFALQYPQNVHYNLSLPSPYPSDNPSHVFVPDGMEGGFIVSRDSISRIGKNGITVTSIYFPNDGPWHFAVHQGKLIYFSHSLDYVEIGSDLQPKTKKISGDLLQLPPGTSFTVYWNAASQQLFMYTEKNVYRLAEHNAENLHSTLLFAGFDFKKHDIITAFYLESQAQLFLGSATKGLFILKKRHFKLLGVGDRYPSNVYYNQTVLRNGLLVTDHGVAFDQNDQPHFSPILQRKEPKYGQIAGPNENLWILQADQILIMPPELDHIVGRKPFPDLPRFAFKDRASNYWFGGENGKLVRYDARADTFRAEASFPSKISYLERKSDNELLIGTVEGLFVFNLTYGTWQEISKFKNKLIRSIRNDSDRRFWITTYQHGFFLYEDGEMTTFPLDRNGYLSTSHCILEDQKGFLWISTNKGMFKVSKQQLLDYKQDESNHPFYFYYDRQWGLNTNEFNGGCEPCAIELPNGHLSFPSMDGLVQYDPLLITDEFPTGWIILDEVTLDKKPLLIHDTIQISRHFLRLDLKISTPFYGSPYNLQIEYMLQRSDGRPSNEWLPVNSPSNTLTFNELAAGNHAIKLRMRKGAHPQAFHYAVFHLYVPPMFHETRWFTVLFCLFIGALIWLTIYVRTRFILKQNRWLQQKVNERTADLKKQFDWQQRLSASITHDIKSPLNYVVKALQRVKKIAKTQGFLPDEMEQIYHSTQHLYNYSDNLTKLAKVTLMKEWLRFSEVRLFDIAQQQIVTFESLARSRGNVIYNHIPADTAVRSHADVLSIIIHNLLDNAIKFTENGEIMLSVEKDDCQQVVFRITDTGMGLHPDQIDYYNDDNNTAPMPDTNGQQSGLGLMLVKDMAQLIHAGFTIESELGCSTTITILLRRYEC
ncbi:ATP-binding protein [Parapedobacter deserti]|uniref:ATP-binding protein n=1 Tax=Parapedobacter deserti TaxID=1912957 RepID=A0ABV7JN18_9SPHI